LAEEHACELEDMVQARHRLDTNGVHLTGPSHHTKVQFPQAFHLQSVATESFVRASPATSDHILIERHDEGSDNAEAIKKK